MMQMLTNFIKGAIIGIANIIPGVSGGTMALIMGIYDDLTESIGDFISNREKRRDYAKFLMVIFVGAVVGILLFAKLLTWLLASPVSEQYTYFFIVGLILGSVPFILKQHNEMRLSTGRLVYLLVGLFLILGIQLIGGNESVIRQPQVTRELFGLIKITSVDLQYHGWLLFCGFVAASAMVLPGISGSALLVSLGEYGNILYAIDQRLIVPGVFFGIGILLGIVICAKVISLLIRKYTAQTYYFIIGLMLSSVIQIILQFWGRFQLSFMTMTISVIALIGGVVTSYMTGNRNNK